MRWFGASWNAPVCKPAEHTVTPVGETCPHCSRTIGPTSQGVIMPFVISERPWMELRPYHRLCLLENFGVKLTVHVLDQGLPLCRFSTAVPGRWPQGHMWTRIETKDDANCEECLRILEARE